MVSVQSGAALAKTLFPAVGAFGTSALRVGFSAVILLLLHRPWRKPLARSQVALAAGFGATLGVMNICFYQALERIPLGLAVGIEFLGPLSVSLFTSRRPLDLVWALLACIGIYLILPFRLLGEGAASGIDPVGVGFALAAGAAWGGYILAGRAAGASLPGGSALAWGMMFAAILSVPLGVMDQGLNLFSAQWIWPALGIAILSSVLPYSLEMVALRRLPAQTFGTLMSVEPAVAALCGYLLLKESLTLTQWCAIAAVMCASTGVAFTARSSR
jgi:inner membrane transporter RhtA